VTLEGKVAVITGAGRGIGRAHALALAERACAVVVNDRGGAADGGGADVGPAAAVVAEIIAAGGRAVESNHDVTDHQAAAALIDTAVQTFGRLDVVITNAGILRDRTIASMAESEWDDVIAVHLKGTFSVAHHAATYWRAQVKAGAAVEAALITTSSASGLFGNPGQANYGAAKAGIAAFTVIAAMELARYGVTVNCLAPSAVTRLTEDIIVAHEGALTAERKESLDPGWIARVAAWLCGPDARGVTGRVFDVRGRSVAVAAGWHLDEIADQPDDEAGLSQLLTRLAAQAPGNADMNGLRPTEVAS
jgi:NAD(P)-dependent dehydrogenase (short-subunit alcohol dehydrogenase family)